MRVLKRAVTDDPVMLRILAALEERGAMAKDFANFLGLKPQTIDHWKFRDSKTFMFHLEKIAEFTGTSVEFLVTGKTGESEETFTRQEEEIIKKYRQLNKHRQELVREMLKELGD